MENKTMKPTKMKTSGFTLIELLVVIAVIAILATIVVPAVTGALTTAKWTKMLSNGRNVYVLVFEDSLLGSGAFPDTTTYGTQTSTQYFCDLGSSNVFNASYELLAGPGTKVEKRSRDAIIGGGAGAVGTVTTSDFAADENAWSVVLDCDESSPATTPFMLSRNFSYSNTTLPSASTGGNISLPADKATAGALWLSDGNRRACIVQCGGGGKTAKGQLSSADVNPTDHVGDVIQP